MIGDVFWTPMMLEFVLCSFEFVHAFGCALTVVADCFFRLRSDGVYGLWSLFAYLGYWKHECWWVLNDHCAWFCFMLLLRVFVLFLVAANWYALLFEADDVSGLLDNELLRFVLQILLRLLENDRRWILNSDEHEFVLWGYSVFSCCKLMCHASWRQWCI